jgi:hypothetical protein
VGAAGCGCVFSPTGELLSTTNPGGPGGGPGCCDTSSPATGLPGQFNSCPPGNTTSTCVPCCNGFPISTASAGGCCTSAGTTIGTCLPAP